jgi:phosphoenolpyruvate synthase/pyruvate phosphate dikinase
VTLTGTGASPGAVEGRAVVVTDPARADVEPGDILVAYTTDPSWASIMFLAKALVVDIGGVLSHAAVVARELGIPCVMGTQQGTRVLRTGDLCRVDGTAGTVRILERAGQGEVAVTVYGSFSTERATEGARRRPRPGSRKPARAINAAAAPRAT